MANQAQAKWWEVTTKSDCPAIGGRTFRVQAESNLDAKSKVVKQEWGHMFTGLFRFMTAKRVKEQAMDKIEVIVAVYGVPNANGDVLTEQAALGLFDQLRQQTERKAQLPGLQGYHIVDVRIEGDRTSGKIWATFESPESLHRLERQS